MRKSKVVDWEKLSVAEYYSEMITPMKNNEQYIMSKLDRNAKSATDGKKGGGMGEAVSQTEKIRGWEDHMWDNEELCKRLKTNPGHGLTNDQLAASRE